ncbi:MAG: 16S rRNA (cytidine(1402)-2'-O)-methyltransferase, partial [Bacteroidetes bacterium]|nr:16S rRNA (cytidine(1402)-2'-O)-methyltransferase [Bacteroidota bacterium]
YESPHRLPKTLAQLAGILGNERRAVVCREMTKMYEDTIRGSLGKLAAIFSERTVKGEIVIVIEGKTD